MLCGDSCCVCVCGPIACKAQAVSPVAHGARQTWPRKITKPRPFHSCVDAASRGQPFPPVEALGSEGRARREHHTRFAVEGCQRPALNKGGQAARLREHQY